MEWRGNDLEVESDEVMWIFFLLYFEYWGILIFILNGDWGWLDESWSNGLEVLGMCSLLCWFDCFKMCGGWNCICEEGIEDCIWDIGFFVVFVVWIFFRVVVLSVW